MLENSLFTYSYWDLCDEDLSEDVDLTREEAEVFFYDVTLKQSIGEFPVGETLMAASINLTKFTITLYTSGGYYKTYNLNLNVEQ